MDLLPEDALLIIFDFYLYGDPNLDAWHTLLHVCQRWRSVVLSSPCRLNLRLLCTETRPVGEMLDIWPAVPIVIRSTCDVFKLEARAYNIIAALEQRDRVRKIRVRSIPRSILEAFAAVAQEPFLALTYLELRSHDIFASPVLPHSFLGGSAPRLRALDLSGIPFSAIRNLLLSASDLVHLRLWDITITNSGYVPPEVIATCLSAMTGLETLELGFPKAASLPRMASRHTPPITRRALPSLTKFVFQGYRKYLNDLVVRLDVPLLDAVDIYSPRYPRVDLLRESIESFESTDSESTQSTRRT